jgi:hypothetical protein
MHVHVATARDTPQHGTAHPVSPLRLQPTIFASRFSPAFELTPWTYNVAPCCVCPTPSLPPQRTACPLWLWRRAACSAVLLRVALLLLWSASYSLSWPSSGASCQVCVWGGGAHMPLSLIPAALPCVCVCGGLLGLDALCSLGKGQRTLLFKHPPFACCPAAAAAAFASVCHTHRQRLVCAT